MSSMSDMYFLQSLDVSVAPASELHCEEVRRRCLPYARGQLSRVYSLYVLDLNLLQGGPTIRLDTYKPGSRPAKTRNRCVTRALGRAYRACDIPTEAVLSCRIRHYPAQSESKLETPSHASAHRCALPRLRTCVRDRERTQTSPGPTQQQAPAVLPAAAVRRKNFNLERPWPRRPAGDSGSLNRVWNRRGPCPVSGPWRRP